MNVLLFPLVALLAAVWLTGWFRRHALASRILDAPNARSSHTVVTPRGGGVAIVLATLVVFPALAAYGALPWTEMWALLLGGAVVALIGFADDLGHVAPSWRLLSHFLGAACVLVGLNGFPSLHVLGATVNLGWPGHVIGAVYLVWLLNLTNFMDGIDGIASVETITVSLSGALLYLVAAPGSMNWLGPVVLASAALGFLIWNWAPAKIFMGDAGSGFLGLTLGAFSLQAARVSPALFWSWVILLGAFIVDATITLLRRVARQERFYEAHRSHAYQHATQRWGSHRSVTIAVGAINLCWLLPVAVLVARGSLDGVTGVVIAYAPLAVAALWLEAGKPSDG